MLTLDKIMKKLVYYTSLLILIVVSSLSCESEKLKEGPYFGNGIHNGWADQNSIVIWTRLTKTPDLNLTGQKFTEIDHSEYRKYPVTTPDEFLETHKFPIVYLSKKWKVHALVLREK